MSSEKVSEFSVLPWEQVSGLEKPVESGYALFNSDLFAQAQQIEGKTPYVVQIDGSNYLGYKRHSSLVIPGLSLADMLNVLRRPACLRRAISNMGIAAVSLNSLNAGNDSDALRRILNLKGKVRYEFLLETATYTVSGISSNHKRNIKKSVKAELEVRVSQSLEAGREHLRLVNENLDAKGVGHVTSTVEWLEFLCGNDYGLLLQVFSGKELLASLFLIYNDDCAYYHSAGTSQDAKKLGVAHYLVDRAVSELKSRNIRYFNLGGCTPDQAGLMRFKMGFRPKVQILYSSSFMLSRGLGSRVRSLLATRPKDVFIHNAVRIYLKRNIGLPTVKELGIVEPLRSMNFEALLQLCQQEAEFTDSLRKYCRPSPNCFGLEGVKGEVVAIGFIETVEENMASSTNLHSIPPDIAEITHLYVLKSERGKGWGKLLVSSLLPEVCKLGYKNAYARVNQTNSGSQRTFESAGFCSAGKERSVSTSLLGGRTLYLNHVKI